MFCLFILKLYIIYFLFIVYSIYILIIIPYIYKHCLINNFNCNIYIIIYHVYHINYYRNFNFNIGFIYIIYGVHLYIQQDILYINIRVHFNLSLIISSIHSFIYVYIHLFTFCHILSTSMSTLSSIYLLFIISHHLILSCLSIIYFHTYIFYIS